MAPLICRPIHQIHGVQTHNAMFGQRKFWKKRKTKISKYSIFFLAKLRQHPLIGRPSKATELFKLTGKWFVRVYKAYSRNGSVEFWYFFYSTTIMPRFFRKSQVVGHNSVSRASWLGVALDIHVILSPHYHVRVRAQCEKNSTFDEGVRSGWFGMKSYRNQKFP